MTTHASYFDILMNSTDNMSAGTGGGFGYDLGNGHAVLEYAAPWAGRSRSGFRAGAKPARPKSPGNTTNWSSVYGKDRADRIALKNRNLFIFPNLVVNDIMALTVRTYFPMAPDYMVIKRLGIGANDETAWARKYRLNNFLEFLGPGGFATPDDAEALEHCQARVQEFQGGAVERHLEGHGQGKTLAQ